MSDPEIRIVKDVLDVDQRLYQDAADQYVNYARTLPFVRGVYQFGGVNDPGISDLDLLVVVDPVYDPAGIARLSVAAFPTDKLLKYPFVHDVYLYDSASFRRLPYSLYCDDLRRLWGDELPIDAPGDEERKALSLAVIFDFVISRLAQFQVFLASGRLGIRSVLVRASSIRHSYRLLGNLGVRDAQIEEFIDRVSRMRKSWRQLGPKEVFGALAESAYQFSRLSVLAAGAFADRYLRLYSRVEPSTVMKINAGFLARFSDRVPEIYKTPQRGLEVHFPPAAFYHYLAYTLCDGLLGAMARRHIAWGGGETFELAPAYLEALGKRLDVLGAEAVFLKKNRASFAMAGQPGFVVDWDGIDDGEFRRDELAVPAEPAPPPRRFNAVVDATTAAVPFERLAPALGVAVDKLALGGADLDQWVERLFPDWASQAGSRRHKKYVELFVTYSVLAPGPDDVFMDAAGGIHTYIQALPCRQRYVQNIRLSRPEQARLGGVRFIQGDAASIALPDGSVTRISCHHSFEHFQGESDGLFIGEVQRLLAVGGRCCIVPVFLGTRYVEVTRAYKPQCHYDPASQYVCEPACRLTGGDECGDYARIYDPESFRRRVLDRIDRGRFSVRLAEVEIDGRTVPDPSLPDHFDITAINFPYRALVIERLR